MLKTIRYVALVLFATVTLSACQTSGVSGELKNYNSVSDYPRPTVSQVYETNFKVNQQSNAKQRRLYVDLINASTGKEGYAPRYYVMSTDKDDTTLVAVSASKRYLENIYQARAGLSRFGASARLLPLFEGHKEAGDYSTLDLLYHLGFKRLVLTNGDNFTYKIDLQEKVSPAVTSK